MGAGGLWIGTAVLAILLTGAAIGLRKSAACPAGRECLEYMAWGNPEQLAVEQKLVDRFNQKNPDIFVNLIDVPDYVAKLTVMLASDTAPDVERVDHYNFPKLVEKGYFADLTGYANSDPDFKRADYWPIALNECMYRNRLYGVNVLFGSLILYYNKDLFKKNGLEDPYESYKKGRWTWARFREDAIKITHTDGNGEPDSVGCPLPDLPAQAVTLYGFGGDFLSADHKKSVLTSERAVDAYQFWTDLIWKDHAAPTPAQAANSAFAFETGKTGMALNFMGMSPTYRNTISKFQWDVCPPPSNGQDKFDLVKGNQLVVSANCRHKAAAWRFVKYMVSAPVETILHAQYRRAFPTRFDVTGSRAYLRSDTPPYQIDAFVESVKHARPLPIDDRWSEWTQELNSETDNLWSGRDKNARTVLTRASAKIDKVLSEAPGF